MRKAIIFRLNSAVRRASAGALGLAVACAAHGQYTTNTAPVFPDPNISFESSDIITFLISGTTYTLDGGMFINFNGLNDDHDAYSSFTGSDTVVNEASVDFVTNYGDMKGSMAFTVSPGTPNLDGSMTYSFDVTGLSVGDSAGAMTYALTLNKSVASSGASLVSYDSGTKLWTVNPAFSLFTDLSVNGSGAVASNQGSGHNGNGSMYFTDSFGASTPEPFTMGLGLAGIGMFLRRRMKAKA